MFPWQNGFHLVPRAEVMIIEWALLYDNLISEHVGIRPTSMEGICHVRSLGHMRWKFCGGVVNGAIPVRSNATGGMHF